MLCDGTNGNRVITTDDRGRAGAGRSRVRQRGRRLASQGVLISNSGQEVGTARFELGGGVRVLIWLSALRQPRTILMAWRWVEAPGDILPSAMSHEIVEAARVMDPQWFGYCHNEFEGTRTIFFRGRRNQCVFR